jgi:hypothetical protein
MKLQRICVIVLSVVGITSCSTATDERIDIYPISVGDVTPNSRIDELIRIRNDSAHTITVKSLIADCSCVDKDISSTSIKPGEDAELAVSLLTPSTRGPFSHRVAVQFTDGSSKVAIVQGTVGAWFSVSEPFLDFGVAHRGAIVQRECVITLHGPSGREDQRPESSLSLNNARIVHEEFQGRRIAYTILFEPSSESLYGKYQGELLVGWRDTERQIRVPCSGEVAPILRPFPEKLFFGVVSRGQVIRSSIALRQLKGFEQKIEMPTFRISQNLVDALDVKWEQGSSQVCVELDSSRLPAGPLFGEIELIDVFGLEAMIPVELCVE